MIGFLFGFWLGGFVVSLLAVRQEDDDGYPLSWSDYLDPSVFLPLVFWPYLMWSINRECSCDECDDDQHGFPHV